MNVHEKMIEIMGGQAVSHLAAALCALGGDIVEHEKAAANSWSEADCTFDILMGQASPEEQCAASAYQSAKNDLEHRLFLTLSRETAQGMAYALAISPYASYTPCHGVSYRAPDFVRAWNLHNPDDRPIALPDPEWAVGSGGKI